MNLKDQILSLVVDYYKENFKNNSFFNSGRINYAGRVFDEREIVNLVDSALEFWLTSGRYTKEFEAKLRNFLSIRYAAFVNSGSSADLIAFYALTAPNLGARRILPGDEVITVAACFPTTISPIIQYGAIPVFIDITIPEYNIDVGRLEDALSSRTKAVFVAHTLGNPFNVQYIRDFCNKHDLWLVEDNCDALGSEYVYNNKSYFTGTIGDIGTSSFYPPHHITTGEGGAVYTNNSTLYRNILSFRDWGRDCWCDSGVDNTCKKRFSQKFGDLPLGYDHKYVYSNFGFNLKATEMQAAVGVAQIDKLPTFIHQRVSNWEYLYNGLEHLKDYFYLPKALDNSSPSWFGFLLTLKEKTPFTRNQLSVHLESKGIQTRNLFAGNILKHPCFDEMRKGGYGYRIVGDLNNTNKVMNDGLWVGVYPGISKDMLDYMIFNIEDFVKEYK